jgi:hypothetical protein
VTTTLDQLYKYGKTNLEPPLQVACKKGRKKKKRYESQSVVPRPNGRCKRKCPLCAGYGHFQSSCPRNPNKKQIGRSKNIMQKRKCSVYNRIIQKCVTIMVKIRIGRCSVHNRIIQKCVTKMVNNSKIQLNEKINEQKEYTKKKSNNSNIITIGLQKIKQQ